MNHLVFETALGFAALAWSERGIARFALPQDNRALASSHASRWPGSVVWQNDDDLPSEIVSAMNLVRRYAEGEAVSFEEPQFDLDGIDTFRRAIYSAACKLGHGVTTTYGALAEDAGFPGLARETGQPLGSNPIPLMIPCHRILAAGGKIGGFSAPGGAKTKAKLLLHEGVVLASPTPAQNSFNF